jgi:hypothetical protein
MLPATVNLNDHMAGDTWEGMTIGPVQFNTGTEEVPVLEPPPFPVASCRMQFRTPRDVLGYEFVSEEVAGKGLITISDAAAWEFIVAPQALPLATGKWIYNFETTDTAGTVRTLYAGLIVIRRDVTYG